MTFEEAIQAKKGEILDIAKSLYEEVLWHDGSIECEVYIWGNGVIAVNIGPCGSCDSLKAYDCEPRDLYFIGTISAPHFSWEAVFDDPIPDEDEDPEGYWHERSERIQYVLEAFDPEEWLDEWVNMLPF